MRLVSSQALASREAQPGGHALSAKPQGGSGLHSMLATLQRAHGNQSVQRLLRSAAGPLVQRKCAACEEEVARAPSESSPGSAAPEALAGVDSVLRSSASAPLDSQARSFLEPRFGHDFSQVRIHADDRAAESARSLNAHAYTVGQDVVFGAGMYQPRSHSGLRLLAHELTHVVQQSSRSSTPAPQSASLEVSDPGDAHEREADQVADRVMRSSAPAGSAPPEGPSSTGSLRIQRACPPTPTHLGDSAPHPACADPTASPSSVKFLFCLDSDEPAPGAEAALIAFIPTLTASIEQIEVHGYASPEGPTGREAPYNLRLSCHRANRVADILVAHGIARSRIRTFRHGGTTALGTPDQNRSVVIPTPAPRPATTLSFRTAAVSYLGCAPCNPYTDDGSKVTSPPTAEPAVGSGYRMLHWMEGQVVSPDGIHVASSSIVASGHDVGVSGYCGTHTRAHVVSAGGPTAARVVGPGGVEGIAWRSSFFTRVGAVVPPTLPGSPCGFLGTSSLIPVIHNTYQMRLFANGTRDSAFLSASTYPMHYLYENRALKMSGGAPVHPLVDFDAWATSTTPLPLSILLIGFKALRNACCFGGVVTMPLLSIPLLGPLATCRTACVGGLSVPVPGVTGLADCAAISAVLAGMACPTCYNPTTFICSPPNGPANP